MVNKTVSIIDYGVGNLLSVRRALEACGATVKIVSSPEDIMKSDRIVLPGVGSFGACIGELRKREFESSILEFIKSGNPLLGICVGMQILQESGEEFGLHKGLGVISGKVIKIKSVDEHGSRKVPFVGWAKLIKNNEDSCNLFEGIDNDSYFYFVHSFKAETQMLKHTLFYYEHEGTKITALVNKENVFGCQFHPEKSGKAGLSLLKNYLKM